MIIADLESKGINNTMSFDNIETLLSSKPKNNTFAETNQWATNLEKAVRS